jgi:hypothetical protein
MDGAEAIRMVSLNQPLLINILGHAGGALIFAIFLVLLFNRRGWSGAHGRKLSALAATLSLLWNLGSLVVLMWHGLPPVLIGLVVAVSFSVLSLLPAVLLHISSPDRHGLVLAGYLLSASAVAMHFWEIRGNGAELHQVALLLITVGFLVLTATAVGLAVIQRGVQESGGARIAASMCLALFATSFVHFGNGHAGQAWSAELIVHHAGIPLALFVLLQDYRFVLLDAFVRFLANALLAAVLTVLVIEAAFRLALVERVPPEPLQLAMLLGSVCFFLVLFAWLRNRAQAWLTQVVFRRRDISSLLDSIHNLPQISSEEDYLGWASARMAAAVRTSRFAVLREDEAVPDWTEASIPLRLGQGDSRLILLGRREGGQRYLGEDLEFLMTATGVIVEHVEATRQHEMHRLVNQAELRALQSQINPHFLFNALNALYGAIPRDAAVARRMVLNLAGIFRYFLMTDKTFVPLEKELEIVRAYLDIEQLRLGERLRVEMDVEETARAIPIPALSIQPLVENAIKHGIALRTEPGTLRIRVFQGTADLHIIVENSEAADQEDHTGAGTGLSNIRRRLEICYGAAAVLALSSKAGLAVAELTIPQHSIVSTV